MIPLFLFTYNCNKQSFDREKLLPYLEEEFPSDPAALFVFGIQEMCSILDGSFHDVSQRHLIDINESLLLSLQDKYGQSFQTVGLVTTGAIGLVAISPYPLQITEVSLALAGIGRFNSSMKGAVGLRLQYKGLNNHDTSEFTFVNAHLNAFEGEYYYLQRNQAVHRLFRAVHFDDGFGVLKPDCHTFFMGDLNYRTTKKYNYSLLEELFLLMDHSFPEEDDGFRNDRNDRNDINDPETVNLMPLSTALSVSTAYQEKIQRLVIKFDELTAARKKNEVFSGFSEAPITFAPTYKYHIGTAIYKNKRSPSWCDRILYQSTYRNEEFAYLDLKRRQENRKNHPKIHKYDSLAATLSDHQPVFLYISVPVEPPQLIVSAQGYLQILPIEELGEGWSTSTDDINSGPTQIYVKPTKIDDLSQRYIRPLSNFVIGWGLWFTILSGVWYLLAAVYFLVAYWKYH